MDNFQVGDRFVYIDTGNEGEIIGVNNMAGTVRVVYDRSKKLVKRGEKPTEHTLGIHKIANITGIPESFKQLNGSSVVKPDTTSDTRTNQLLNELYHDRARLEKIIRNHVESLKEFDGRIDIEPSQNGKPGDTYRFEQLLVEFVNAND
jgi:hypothetical protein